MTPKDSRYTRRGFLTTAATGLAALPLAGLTPTSVVGQEEAKEGEKKAGKIITRKLGKTGFTLPIVSMGVMNANNPGVVQASYEMGVRHFDTAAYYQYGRNEQMVGKVVSDLGIRDKVIIGTKVYTPAQRRGRTGEDAKQKFMSIFEASLKRLKMDYVDILYMHDVSDPEDVTDPAVHEILAELKEQGRIRAAGVSTHSQMAAVINAAVKSGAYDVVLTSINFTMADDTDLLKAIENASTQGIGVVAMKTLAGGARWPNPETREKYDSQTIAKAALKWVLRNPHVHTSIPGYDNHEHRRTDFSVAYDLEYTDEEQQFLSDNSIKLGMGFCRQCRGCLASCPQGVDVPNLMRTHMYAAQYGNFHQARATLDDIPKDRGLAECTSCKTCTAECANTVDIPRRIEELKLMYG